MTILPSARQPFTQYGDIGIGEANVESMPWSSACPRWCVDTHNRSTSVISSSTQANMRPAANSTLPTFRGRRPGGSANGQQGSIDVEEEQRSLGVADHG